MNHFDQFRSSIKEIIKTHHFERDLPGFDTSLLTDSEHESFTELHKYEENIEGNHIFRALQNHVHIVYAIDKIHRLIMLRAFKNFKEYLKFLDSKKEILNLISGIQNEKI